MKNQTLNEGCRDKDKGGKRYNKLNGAKSIAMKKKNEARMGGGGGLSIESLLSAKSANTDYNPAVIKKKREFYKNAKYVTKFNKSVKRQSQTHLPPFLQDDNKAEDQSGFNRKKDNKNKGSYSLNEVYEKKRQEVEKARIEKEAIIQAKKEHKERAEAQRKAAKEKMLKKTQHGQPVQVHPVFLPNVSATLGKTIEAISVDNNTP
ncbi:hypothetical protein ACFE04_017676 [Oxalis oulophora]